MNYILQIIFMLIAFFFMGLVLKEQWYRYKNTRTEYAGSRRVLLILVSLVFIGNFSHLQAGHLIHSVLLAVVGLTWWYWYKIIAEELADRNRLAAALKKIADELALEALAKDAQLTSAKIFQESQSEAIAELPNKMQQKVNDTTAVKNIEKVAEINDKENGDTIKP